MTKMFAALDVWNSHESERLTKGGLIGRKGPKCLFKYGKERSIVCNCTLEEKINFEGFTQSGCYGNQPHPLEASI